MERALDSHHYGTIGLPWAVPIPGFHTPGQVEREAGAGDVGPLTADQMTRNEVALGR